MLRRSALALAVLAAPAWAQDDDRDPGFLAGLIEDNLSAPGLTVQIDGFRGALSSEASIDELRIADDEGTWLVLQDVVLDWNRSALLRGRLDVEQLTAALIQFERAPLPPEGIEPPAAAASGFSLPNLPVAVDVERLAAERIELGAALLGEPIALTLEASAQLDDGSAYATVEARRLDGPEGTFSIQASFSNDAPPVLALDLDVREAEGGIAATLLSLPGAPEIELTIAGEGPLDAFAADIQLASDGVERLGGRVALNGTEEGRRFDVDLGGDVTELFAPRYKAFFGEDIALVASGLQADDGSLTLDTLDLDTQALTLDGSLRMGADGWPERIDIDGELISEDGTPVLLPTAGNVTLRRGTLTLDHDSSQSDNWTLDLTLLELNHPEIVLGDGAIRASGVIGRDEGGVAAATAMIEATLNQLALTDPGLAGALGPRVSLDTDVEWMRGEPVRVSELVLAGPEYSLRGTLGIAAGQEEGEGLPLTLDLTGAFEDIARLSGLAGRDLAGAAEISVEGDVDPLAGTFDLVVEGAAQDLAIDLEQVDGLIDGETTLFADARRSLDGTFVDTLRLENDQLSVNASGEIYGAETEARAEGRIGQAQFEARIADGTVIDPRLDGEIALVADLTEAEDGAWSGNLDALAPHGVTVSASGRLTGDNPDLTFAASAPDLSPYAPDIEGSANITGRASAVNGTWTVETEAAGPYGIDASISGPLTGPDPRIAFEATVPDLSQPVPAVADIEALRGTIQLDGLVTRPGDAWTVDTALTTEGGIDARIEGTLTGDAPSVTATARVPQIEDFSDALDGTPLTGAATIEATASQAGEVWSVDADIATDGGITASISGPATGDAPEIAFEARVPRIESFAEPLEQIEPLTGAATVEGMARQADGIWSVDADLATEGGATASVSGPVTGDAPEIAFTATVPDATAFAEALEAYDALSGPATVSGTLARSEETWRVDAALDGPGGVTARAIGPVAGPDAIRLEFITTVDDVGAFVPVVGGTLSVDGTLDQTDEGFALDARATGPLGAHATVQTVLAAPLEADFTLSVPSLEELAPIPGGIDVTGTVRQDDDGIDVDVAGTGPYDARFEALAALGETISVTADGQIPNAAQISPQLRGPIDFDAAARQLDGIWTVDADISGGPGLDITLQGPATGPNANLVFRADVANVSAFVPQLPGSLAASGRLFAQGDAYAFEVDASGPLGADLTASGTLTGGAPQARFDLSIPDIGPLVPELSGPLRASGTAAQQGGGWAVDVDLTGPGGTTANVSGTAAGTDLNLDVTGQARLGLANAFIEPRRINGVARFDLDVNGPPALESVSGTVSVADGTLTLPTLRSSLENIDATIAVTAGRANLDLRAVPDSGGVLTVQGPLALTPPFDGNLAIRFDGRIEDPTLYSARVIAEVDVNGPLAGGASITGDILIDEAEIAVPSTGLTAIGELPPIRHVRVPRPVQRTLAHAGQDAASLAEANGAGAGGGGGAVYPLDLTVRAPNRIFVRGRGLDAELGGEIFIDGTTASPVISGGFELARGRLDILQQRFELDEGTITFQGSFVPYIRLVAATETDTLDAAIVVEGPADAPEVSFESSPEVPQEEILAQIFFGRDLSSLSPLQALQLANSVATLAGRGNGGLLENLRGTAGLDDLDLTTDSEGNVALRAGKYISDNVYTDVQIDQDGDAKVTLNLDVTPNLTVRGSTGAAGDTSIGVFFEKDY